MPYHIKKTKRGNRFYNTMTARNGEVLTTSETMNNYAAVVKNIKAQVKQHASINALVVFDEVKKMKYNLLYSVATKKAILGDKTLWHPKK